MRLLYYTLNYATEYCKEKNPYATNIMTHIHTYGVNCNLSNHYNATVFYADNFHPFTSNSPKKKNSQDLLHYVTYTVGMLLKNSKYIERK